jgi:hypothetical protein
METPTSPLSFCVPGKVRRTADPSASLGMTKKERVIAKKRRLLEKQWLLFKSNFDRSGWT